MADKPAQATTGWRRLWEWLTGQDVIREYEAAKREAARRVVEMVNAGR